MKRTLIALMIMLSLFSVISGCKLKHKINSKSQTSESASKDIAENSFVKTKSSSQHLLTDTSRVQKIESKKELNKNSIEVTFELDSGKKTIISDSSGNFSMNALVTAALQNARKLKIKVEQQQSTESRKKQSLDIGRTESQQELTELKKVKENSSSEKFQSETLKKESDTLKDGTIRQNLGGGLIIIALAALAGYFIFRK